MEEPKSQGQYGEGYRCMHHGMCCGWHGHGGFGWRVLRIVLAIVLLGFVFAFGVKIGELKGAYEYGGGYPFGMHGWYGGAYPMMGGYYPQGYYQPQQGVPMMRIATSTGR